MRIEMVDGLKTVFYDGSILFDDRIRSKVSSSGRVPVVALLKSDPSEYGQPLHYDWKERESWQQVIIEPHVEVIPPLTFFKCSIERVIMQDDSKLVEVGCAAFACNKISNLKLPTTNLKVIGPGAFLHNKLSSVFIPPNCEEMKVCAFVRNPGDIICVPKGTKIPPSPTFIPSIRVTTNLPFYSLICSHLNKGEEYSLHRICASFQPKLEDILAIVNEKGLQAFQDENEAGTTPSQYLRENPYAGDVTEKKIAAKMVTRNILTMMGEVE